MRMADYTDNDNIVGRSSSFTLPTPKEIQAMVQKLRQLASPTASVPEYYFPSSTDDKSITPPGDLPINDVPYIVTTDATIDPPMEFLLRPIYYQALPYKNILPTTKVFAWIGLPHNHNNNNNTKQPTTIPGMVLVHGGGGTAYKEWVERWAQKGYAAISIAVEGQTDERDNATAQWKQHSNAGPQRVGIYGDYRESLLDQWMFHALADTILAHTLLRSFTTIIDASRIGIMGISWGGVITATVMGLDPRFSLAIPVYGCGHLRHNSSCIMGKALQHNPLYEKVWDPCLYLRDANMPSLWLSWPDDIHFPMDCLKFSYENAAGPVMVSLVPHLNHCHPVAWRRPESYTFAKYVWEHSYSANVVDELWCHQVSGEVIPSSRNNNNNTLVGQVKFTCRAPFSFHTAQLIWSAQGDDIPPEDRQWNYDPATLLRVDQETYVAHAVLPDQVQGWMINLYTGHDRDDGLVVTSTYQDSTLFAFAVMVDIKQDFNDDEANHQDKKQTTRRLQSTKNNTRGKWKLW